MRFYFVMVDRSLISHKNRVDCKLSTFEVQQMGFKVKHKYSYSSKNNLLDREWSERYKSKVS